MLIILFGLAGSGKNFVGNILANEFGYYFWDADQTLTETMRTFAQEKKPFKQSMRNELTQIIIEKINELQKIHPNLVVSQALIKEQNRQTILNSYPEALFIYVKTMPDILFKRLKARNDWVDEGYAIKMATIFDEPILAHRTLLNDGNQTDIIKQLKSIICPKN